MKKKNVRISLSPVVGLIVVWLTLFTVVSAQSPSLRGYLKEGDIVFQQLIGGALSNAIDSVTRGYHDHDYNHCGLVVNINDTLQIIEAIGKSVQLSSVETVEGRCDPKDLLVGRLKPAYKHLIPFAVEAAIYAKGIPYDDYFVLNNEKLYCSELIYEVFKTANAGKPLFTLEPMTFKNPRTHQFFPVWVDYFHSLAYPIPQGKPGINPGLLSRSPLLTIIFPR